MNLKSKFGFTLIELLVVMFITGLIATMSLANFRQGEKRKRVALASDTVLTALTLAQNYSLAGKATNNPNANCRVPLSYYVYISSAQLYLAAKNNCLGANDLIEMYPLPTGTRLKAAGLSINGSTNNTWLAIDFKPPYASLTAGGDVTPFNTTFNTITITVESTDGTASKTITVDGVAGRIE